MQKNIDETLQTAKEAQKQALTAAVSAEKEYREKYRVDGSPLEYSEMYKLDDILGKENALADAREKLEKKKNDMHETAKANVLPPEKSSLEAVPENADGDEKRKIRKLNKQVKDRLAERANGGK